MLNFNGLKIKSSKEVEIFGINIGNNLNFNNHIKSVCRKADQNLCALLRISSNLKTLLYTSMIKPQFNYCPLPWTFCSRQSNNLIIKIHKRSPRVSCRDDKTSYLNLLKTHNELTIYQRDL